MKQVKFGINYKRLYEINVTKFPIIGQNAFQISGWLKFYNYANLLYYKLKFMTLDKYSNEYTNQLKQMFSQYRKSYYFSAVIGYDR